ncbi:MAG TPA: OadG family protein [Anaerolineae bacterium]|nr:OadG family protein [Anaerolineae bacterium]
MAENLSLSLQITLIGMGLVFGAIILLWIMMVVLVRLTPDREEAAEPEATAPIEPTANRAKQRAAIAAVAVALAHEATPKIHEFPLPATPIVSAWQAVQRGRQLNQHGPRQK